MIYTGTTQPTTAPGAGTIMEPKAELFTEPRAGPATEPGGRLAMELRAKPGTEPGAKPATEPRERLADIEELLVSIASITLINVCKNGLHDLIRTYNDKKQANHYSKPL